MAESARELIQAYIDNDHLLVFAHRLAEWLIADLNRSDEAVPDFTESRAKALLRAANVVDDPTRHNFAKLMENNITAVRLALYDLLKESELAANEEVAALAAVSGATEPGDKPVAWTALALAAFAWKDGYPLYQLDPASPPGAYTPAGQLLSHAGHFMRQQVQRTATERDKLGRQVAYQPTAAAPGTPSLDQLSAQGQTPPLPPHYRPPIPVRYSEVARDTIQINDEDTPDLTLNVEEGIEDRVIPPRAPQITITEQDLPDEKRPATMPPIRIERSQVQPAPRPVINTRPQNEFGQAVQRRYRSRGPMSTTKLRITVQEYTDGPGLYGVQVRVKCQGIRSYVAGTTNREGKFLCELPVPRHAGLTYDAEITWPRDVGGDIERKSITLNADRTEFTLPFYRRVHK
jgi:hypothetical protein